jgi:vanillate O-demethylase ferredoxin subunit
LDKKLISVKVDQIVEAANGIRAFTVSRVDGQPLAPYHPGAHVDVSLPGAPTRQYSLCGDPRDTKSYAFAVKLEASSRGGSKALHDEVAVGSELTLSQPRSLFVLQEQASHHYLFAAGIGITPLLSMAYRLIELKAQFELHYFVRSPHEAAFLPLLQSAPFAPHLRLHVGVPRTDIGARLAVLTQNLPKDAHVYTCGPEPFMDMVTTAAEKILPDEHIHLERFAVATAAAEAQGNATLPNTFEVHLAKLNKTVLVADGVSIVDALAAIDVEIDVSCGEGICGTCTVEVLEGDIDHRDHCLSKAERARGDILCCCVSRATSPRLVLNL